jgi:monoamine oxidase
MTKKTEKTEKWNNGWSRRKFLTKIALVGGASALYETMVAMNLINLPTEWQGIPKLDLQHGKDKSVLILGAGIGGLTTAYILSQYGYRCQILEATSRAGGRNHTARRGSTILEEDKEGNKTMQECNFDSGLYLNLGPGRLPYHHRRALGYCQELGVELEPYIMNTTGNLFQTDLKDTDGKVAFDGKPKVYRKLQNDTKGYIAELLAKALNQNALDKELSKSDKSKLLSLLETFGPLKDNYKYAGSTRDGCGTDPNNQQTPNVFYNCEVPEKTPLDELLKSEFWEDSFYSPAEFEWQPTLFQPVGGMDMIVEGFLRKVEHLITYNSPVVKIDAQHDGVAVTYMDGADRKVKTADYCVSNIPCTILKKIENNFDQDDHKYESLNKVTNFKKAVSFKDAVDRTTFASSCKVGWQCNTRFWESQKYQIYGGISWTNDIIEQIWYPSNGYFSQKGVLTGAYIHDNVDEKHASKFGKYPLKKRLQVAKEGGEKLHDEFKNDTIVPTDLGLSIAWQNVPYQEGAWPSWDENNQHDNDDYERILRPFRSRFFIVGDQASTLPGWQEGAMMSAEHVIALIAGLEEVRYPEQIQTPNTIKVTQGQG